MRIKIRDSNPARECQGASRRSISTRACIPFLIYLFSFMSPRDQSKVHHLFFFLFTICFFYPFLFRLSGRGDARLFSKECYHSFYSPDLPFYILCLKFSCQILYENYTKKIYTRIVLRSCVMNLYIKGYMRNLLDSVFVQFC